ncbi:MAG: NAD(P)-dependent oxidoreductase [Chloroflexota bacterium]
MRLLVTGATGFVGRSLVPALLPDHDLTLLLREEYAGGKLLPPPLDKLRSAYGTVYADLRNYNLTSRAVRDTKPEAVIHLAAAGVTDPFLPVNTALSHNVTGTLNLARACFQNGGSSQQLIIARTPGELTALNVYAASKAAAWSFCQMYARTAGWPIRGAMIFQAYGPNQSPHLLVAAALRAALAGEQFPMTMGSQAKDWVYIADVVAGIRALLDADVSPGTTVDLGTGTLTSVLRVVEMLYELVGRGGHPLPGALPSRPGETPQPAADVTTTLEQIDWQAHILLEDGLRMLVENAIQEKT